MVLYAATDMPLSARNQRRSPKPMQKIRILCLSLLALTPAIGFAQSPETEEWNAKFQSTYIWQGKPSFGALYSGANSLSPQKEKSYSFTATAALGVRLWPGSEFYFNPEAAQGVPLSRLTGLGGFTNGEMARTSGPNLTFYRARLFMRQSWGFGGGTEKVESDANQLAGMVDKRRLVLTIGNLSVIDIFDDNVYSHDPRTQFMNWSIMTHGAYDFAADARGYSTGVALEYFHDAWAFRAGRFAQPKEPNQLKLEYSIDKHYGDQIEVEHAHALGGQPGKIRVLAFRNYAKMSRFSDALAVGAATATTPDINNVRFTNQSKRGIGVNLEQAVSDDVGVFARAMWADGKTETYAFTEIDRSVSGGVVVKGSRWGRSKDNVGVAFASNGLSSDHRNYIAAGGLGFFIGDGALNYKRESVFETYYSLSMGKFAWLSVGWQRIKNPAYNADRGPATATSLRLHTEF